MAAWEPASHGRGGGWLSDRARGPFACKGRNRACTCDGGQHSQGEPRGSEAQPRSSAGCGPHGCERCRRHAAAPDCCEHRKGLPRTMSFSMCCSAQVHHGMKPAGVGTCLVLREHSWPPQSCCNELALQRRPSTQNISWTGEWCGLGLKPSTRWQPGLVILPAMSSAAT